MLVQRGVFFFSFIYAEHAELTCFGTDSECAMGLNQFGFSQVPGFSVWKPKLHV